jgi:hypothetical protein
MSAPAPAPVAPATRTLNLVSAIAATAPKPAPWDSVSAAKSPEKFARDLEATLLARRADRALPEQTAFDLRKARARAIRGAIGSADLLAATAKHAAAEAFMADATDLLLALPKSAHNMPLRADGFGGHWTVSDLVSYWLTSESKSDAARRAGYKGA